MVRTVRFFKKRKAKAMATQLRKKGHKKVRVIKSFQSQKFDPKTFKWKKTGKATYFVRYNE